MWKEYQLLPVPPPAPLDGIGWCTHELITPWPHMPSLIQLVQGTEQVLPTAMIRYDSGPGETHLLWGPGETHPCRH